MTSPFQSSMLEAREKEGSGAFTYSTGNLIPSIMPSSIRTHIFLKLDAH